MRITKFPPCFLRLVVLVSVCAGQAAYADTVIEFSYDTDFFSHKEVIESIEEGHRAEIRFELRAYRTVQGIRKLFGDRLVAESTVVYEARKDPLNGTYVVTVGNVRENVFENTSAFLEFFFSLENYRMLLPPVEAENDTESLYVLCRAKLEPIKLVPPLTLMPVIIPGFRTVSSWERVSYQGKES